MTKDKPPARSKTDDVAPSHDETIELTAEEILELDESMEDEEVIDLSDVSDVAPSKKSPPPKTPPIQTSQPIKTTSGRDIRDYSLQDTIEIKREALFAEAADHPSNGSGQAASRVSSGPAGSEDRVVLGSLDDELEAELKKLEAELDDFDDDFDDFEMDGDDAYEDDSDELIDTLDDSVEKSLISPTERPTLDLSDTQEIKVAPEMREAVGTETKENGEITSAEATLDDDVMDLSDEVVEDDNAIVELVGEDEVDRPEDDDISGDTLDLTDEAVADDDALDLTEVADQEDDTVDLTDEMVDDDNDLMVEADHGDEAFEPEYLADNGSDTIDLTEDSDTGMDTVELTAPVVPAVETVPSENLSDFNALAAKAEPAKIVDDTADLTEDAEGVDAVSSSADAAIPPGSPVAEPLETENAKDSTTSRDSAPAPEPQMVEDTVDITNEVKAFREEAANTSEIAPAGADGEPVADIPVEPETLQAIPIDDLSFPSAPEPHDADDAASPSATAQPLITETTTNGSTMPAQVQLSQSDIEASIDRVVREMLSEKIDHLLNQAIESAVKQEIDRLKKELMDE